MAVFVAAALVIGAAVGWVLASRARRSGSGSEISAETGAIALTVEAPPDLGPAEAAEPDDDERDALRAEVGRLERELAAGRGRIDELETELRRFRRWTSDQIRDRAASLAAVWKSARLPERVDELPHEVGPELLGRLRSEAEPIAQLTAEFGLTTPELQFQLGLLDALERRFDRAAGRFQEAAHGGVRPEGWLALGDCQWALGRPKKAARAYDQCREAKRMPTRLFERIAEVAVHEHRYRDALEPLGTALGRSTASERAYLLAATARLELGELEEAVRACETGLETHPDSARLRAAMILPLARLGEKDRAEGCARKALELEPELPDVPVALAVAKLERGDLRGARASLREALQLDGDCAAAHFHLGAIANRESKFKQALDHFREAVRLRPDYAEAYLLMKDSYEGLRDFDNAIAMLNKAVQLNPDYA